MTDPLESKQGEGRLEFGLEKDAALPLSLSQYGLLVNQIYAPIFPPFSVEKLFCNSEMKTQHMTNNKRTIKQINSK